MVIVLAASVLSLALSPPVTGEPSPLPRPAIELTGQLAKDDSPCRPARPMASFFPPAAIAENVGATCQVTFDIGEVCEPLNVRATCTAEKFVEEFENASSRQIELWTFPPERVGETDVVIDLDFEVED